MAGQTTVHSVDKAMTLLEILLSHRAPMTLQELAGSSGYPKSTVHALLTTMRAHAMIEQQNDGRYALGIRLFECGCAVSSAWDIGRLAHPHLEQLAGATGASAFLALLDDKNAISFDQCISATGLQVVPAVGGRMPLHATSQGKVLLSCMSDREVVKLLEEGGMQAFTPHTITDPRRFVAGLAAVRQNGYAVEDGEYRIGLRSAAAPVYDSSGRVRYALGVAGLFRRVQSEDFQNAVAHLIHQARQLSMALGWRGV